MDGRDSVTWAITTVTEREQSQPPNSSPWTKSASQPTSHLLAQMPTLINLFWCKDFKIYAYEESSKNLWSMCITKKKTVWVSKFLHTKVTWSLLWLLICLLIWEDQFQRKRSSTYWFTPQRATVVQPDLGTPSSSSMWIQDPKHLDHHLLPQVVLAGNCIGSRVVRTQTGSPIWDAGITTVA